MDNEETIRETAAVVFRAALAESGVAPELAESRALQLSVALPGQGAEIYGQVDAVKAVLASPSGEYGRKTFAQCLAEDGNLAAQIADPETRREFLKPEPRTVIKRLLYSSLGPADWPAACDLARGLERGVFNATITHFTATSRSDRCQWGIPEFVTAYSARAGTVASALEGGGAAILRGKDAGALDPKGWVGLGIEVGQMDEGAINPAPLQALRDEFEARRHIKVKKRMSHLYKCPKCGAMEAETREIQMRSADEPPTIMCTCVCGVVFRGAG